MSKKNLTWQAADEQLLEALLLATGGEGGASLQDVLLMGDALDGTVLTLQEIEQALEKLVSVGFVLIQKNKLSLSESFLKAYEAITLISGAEELQKPLQKLLEQQEISEEGIARAKTETLKKFKLKAYYQQYLEQFG
ncbi:hypothetical protein H9Q13_14535 [Pontibacter sp. JH31]|uniref:Uncharacterized protein n=1 Tax=Pontibacter aquaedesilientis TaxID=2766980 RepID=A0ABR7XJC3_9BACT|nr:hypothetical protein [Pontibacter aquaedesilientis]MBD1398385.1 hypothetical protein [Pontibacter aquaedesilientis]